MNNKPIIGAAVVIVGLAAVWMWCRRPALVVPQRAPATQPVQPQVAAKPILIQRVKMVTVGGLKQKKIVLVPVRHDWSDVGLIVNDRSDFEKRLEAIGRLPSRLTSSDWNVLRKFLLAPDSADAGQQNQVVKNELMDRLCAMESPPKDLGNVLAAIYQNLLQDDVVRDYAVQHLATLDQALAQNGGNGVAQEEKEDQTVLWNALSETGDSIAGTALLGLLRLSDQQNTGVNQSKVASSALQMAHDSAAGELSQITAYQVCAQLNVQNALPAIEAAAQNSQTIPAQISAIGALGQLGGSGDISLLQNLLNSNQERLQLPVQTAISRIEQRLGRNMPTQL